MAVVNTWAGLFAAIQGDLVDIMNSMDSEWGQDNDNPKYVMMQKVDEEVYQAYNPKSYRTTFQLRDSIEATRATVLGNLVEVTIHHNKDKIKADGWTHGGNSNADMSELLPEIINDASRWGWIDGLFPKDGAWRFDRPYLEMTVRDLTNGRYREWLMRQLIKKGYHVT